MYCQIEFKTFGLRRDLFLGGVLTVLGIWYQAARRLSIRTDWRDHPIVLILSVFLPVILVICLDAAWRASKAAIRLYRARSDSRRYLVRFAAVALIVIGLTAFCAVDWRRRLSHLSLQHGRFYVAQSRSYPIHPNTMLFVDTLVENFGKDTSVKQWKVLAATNNGEELNGEPYPNIAGIRIHPPNQPGLTVKRIDASDLIFLKEVQQHLPQGTSLRGYGVFIFPRVSNETLRIPGTTFTVSVTDGFDKSAYMEFESTAEESALD